MKKKENLPDLDTHACYILITCGEPQEDGKLSVEMTYEGDPHLATYLLESAQGFIEQNEDMISM